MKTPSNKTEAAWYLAALIDGEGCVFCPSTVQRKSPRTSRFSGGGIVIVANSDVALVEAGACCCELLGLTFNRRLRKCPGVKAGRMHELELSGHANLLRFSRLVPIQSPKKQQKLKDIFESYKTPPRATREELEQQTKEILSLRGEGKTFSAIGNEIGCSGHRAWDLHQKAWRFPKLVNLMETE